MAYRFLNESDGVLSSSRNVSRLDTNDFKLVGEYFAIDSRLGEFPNCVFSQDRELGLETGAAE
jgi:hypothetical protein